MGWRTNEHNVRVYTPSAYTNSELPTWNEVYNDYYRNIYLTGDHCYIPGDYRYDDNLDKYWRIPRKKVILALIANQFNKMIHEDGYADVLYPIIGEQCFPSLGRIITDDNGTHADFSNIVKNVHITLDIPSRMGYDVVEAMYDDDPPVIYTLTHPSGKQDPFITNNRRRLSVVSICKPMAITVAVMTDSTAKTIRVEDSVVYNAIIECMMRPYIEYFEGADIPGWKDGEGKLIEGKQSAVGCTTGFDPAL